MFRRGLIVMMVLFFSVPLLLGSALAEEAYKVGFSMAMTGRGSGIYAPIKDAFDLYFKEVNSKGGINGHPVEIIIQDNAAQPSKAAAQAKKFATQDKVILLMNASLSSTFAPMVQVAKRYNIPIFFAGAVCPKDVYPPHADPNQFCSTGFAAKYDSRFALSFIKEEAKGPVKLALVAMNIPVSRGEIDFAEGLSKEMGFEIEAKTEVAETETEIEAETGTEPETPEENENQLEEPLT